MRATTFNTLLCIFSLCLIILLLYSAYSEKFRIQQGNIPSGISSSVKGTPTQTQPVTSPMHTPRHSDSVSPIPPTPSPGSFPRRAIVNRYEVENVYPLWRRRFWRHNPHWNRFFLPNVYWNNTYYPYTSSLDCDNNCCDRGICYETGGLCQWTALGNVYTGTPEQCVRQKECIARNISDGNADIETLCKID